ncbi:hypothetical protein [Schumannella soli]|uniref:Uncharacterized protein n=1 Tax=Schumannella soli TaxID=2590779 RepID=A0A506Y1W7_9MICO|nr:hypothetical protein [Schumannella soli]TPW75600.1 hypothetical protein FJ657_06875 [Schumannella soli]
MADAPDEDAREADGSGNASAPPVSARRRRRVTTAPPAGSDPHPAPEPPRGSGTENDARMRAEKPPHY